MGREEKVIISAPYIDQSVRYPTGCESVSAVMLLQYLGIDITVDEFIKNYLDKRDFKEVNGKIFGPDPRKCFCGSPYDEESFGCYAPVIINAMEKVFTQKRSSKSGQPVYKTVNECGTSLEELSEKYIDRKMPVVCWACIDMREPVIGPQWRLFDTGEIFTWVSNEHCMLLVGYDQENYYFNDPHNGNGLIGYPREITEKRHRAQYMQAVGVVEEQRSTGRSSL